MRKIFSLFLSLILCCVVLSACGNEPAKQPCKHYYVEGICVICGEADSDYVAPCKHNYVDGVCSVCGEADPSYTVPCKHSYADGICTKCGEYDEVYCEEIYLDILNECMTMQNRLKSIEFIQSNLVLLPSGYKDVSLLKEQGVFVKTQFDIFSDAIFRHMMKKFLDDDEKKEYYVDYNKVRRAYLALIDADKDYKHWDLTGAAESWIYQDGESNCEGLLLLCACIGLWEDSDGNFMNFVESESNDPLFGSNLPSNRDSNKSYSYFIDGRIIGYQVVGETSKINAYRIMDIRESYISVYNFKDGYTYRLARK